MRLNPDCIRDILLQIEDKIDSRKTTISFDELLEYLPNYDENTLHYHVNQISKSDLVDKVFYADCRPYVISDLSLEGHEFLANIRSNTNWNKTKEIAKNVGASSLSSLREIAVSVISELIKSQFV